MARLWLVLLLLVSSTLTAYADGDIVYAARYYLPPGSKGTSHFHLYRISPNGTGRRQITYGNSEDYDPHWSPDGKFILFSRDYYTENGDRSLASLCCISVRGGPVKQILDRGISRNDDWSETHWCPGGHTVSIVHKVSRQNISFSCVYLMNVETKKSRRLGEPTDFDWSPDRQHAIVQNCNRYSLYDQKSGKQISLSSDDRVLLWRDSRNIIALGAAEGAKDYDLRLIGLDGQEENRKTLHFPKTYPGSVDVSVDSGRMDLLTTPDKHHFICTANNENSTILVDYYFFDLNLKTDQLRYFAHGQFLRWSPDGKQFCIAPGRDTVPYEKRRYLLDDPYASDPTIDVKYRMVWSAPLYIRATCGGPMRQLTPRLSWVTSADWRKAGQ